MQDLYLDIYCEQSFFLLFTQEVSFEGIAVIHFVLEFFWSEETSVNRFVKVWDKNLTLCFLMKDVLFSHSAAI